MLKGLDCALLFNSASSWVEWVPSDGYFWVIWGAGAALGATLVMENICNVCGVQLKLVKINSSLSNFRNLKFIK